MFHCDITMAIKMISFLTKNVVVSLCKYFVKVENRQDPILLEEAEIMN